MSVEQRAWGIIITIIDNTRRQIDVPFSEAIILIEEVNAL